MREGIDTEEREGGLRFLEFDIAEEKLPMGQGGSIGIIDDEGGGQNAEFATEILEVEFRLVVKLNGIEKDEEGVRTGSLCRDQEPGDREVVEMDHSRFRSGLEGDELAYQIRVWIRTDGEDGEGDQN